jgi:hypothetical protein
MTTISIYRHDDLPAFGAYLRSDGPPDNHPLICINVPAIFDNFVDDSGNDVPCALEDRKRLMVETLMHEFGHAMEHFLGLEVNEMAIENAVESFRPPNAQTSRPAGTDQQTTSPQGADSAASTLLGDLLKKDEK